MTDNFLLKNITKKFVESKTCEGKLRIQQGIIKHKYFLRYGQIQLL